MALPPGIAGTKRPFDLPPASSVSNIDAIVVDDGIEVRKATASQVVANAVQFASPAQAEAGTDETFYMNPKLTADAIAAQALLPATLSSNAGAGLVGTTSGQTVQDALDAAVVVPFSMGAYVNPPLDDDEQLFVYTFTEDITFPADFAGSYASVIELPTATTTLSLLRWPLGDVIANAVPAGSVTIDATGLVTFATAGAVDLVFFAGDAMIAQGQASADATAAYAFTLIGAR